MLVVVDREKVIDEVVLKGLDDWVMLVEVESVLRRATPEARPDQLVAEAVDLIETMSSEGLVEVGDVREDVGGFVPWKVAPAEAGGQIADAGRRSLITH